MCWILGKQRWPGLVFQPRRQVLKQPSLEFMFKDLIVNRKDMVSAHIGLTVQWGRPTSKQCQYSMTNKGVTSTWKATTEVQKKGHLIQVAKWGTWKTSWRRGFLSCLEGRVEVFKVTGESLLS